MPYDSLTVAEKLNVLAQTPFSAESDWSADQRHSVLGNLILSASGWRTVFAGDAQEESLSPLVNEPHRLFACYAADSFARYLTDRLGRPARVAVATDSRPTGYLLAAIVLRTLHAAGHGCEFLGIAPTPQLLAYTGTAPGVDGFVCITASHNPIGHNGFKFGLNDGGVLSVSQGECLTARLRDTVGAADRRSAAVARAVRVHADTISELLQGYPPYAAASREAYRKQALCLLDPTGTAVAARLRAALAAAPLGVIGELNGSARGASIDRELFEDLGVSVELLNAAPGRVVHQVVPEGPGLDDCRNALTAHADDPRNFMLGYVPDNDGDRGNLVYRPAGRPDAQALGAQEVFALTCYGVLRAIARGGETSDQHGPGSPGPVAVVVNGPTSLRIDEIAAGFGAEVYRAEVGEANVLALADDLRAEGYQVPILGEGSNGGAIIPPQRVRDPLAMLITLIKLLRPTDGSDPPDDLPAVLAQLPRWSTTSAYEPQALLRLGTTDHARLKRQYEARFLTLWKQRRDELADRFGIVSYEQHNYEGTNDRAGFGPQHRSGTQNGGLKLLFRDAEGHPTASVWLRGSKTEPVMRLMAECRGGQVSKARALLSLQRELVSAADE